VTIVTGADSDSASLGANYGYLIIPLFNDLCASEQSSCRLRKPLVGGSADRERRLAGEIDWITIPRPIVDEINNRAYLIGAIPRALVHKTIIHEQGGTDCGLRVSPGKLLFGVPHTVTPRPDARDARFFIHVNERKDSRCRITGEHRFDQAFTKKSRRITVNMLILGPGKRRHASEASQYTLVRQGLPEHLEQNGIAVEIWIVKWRFQPNRNHETAIAYLECVAMFLVLQV
jgi:hypothetical protein